VSILVIDVGTSAVRAAIVTAEGSVEMVHRLAVSPSIPFPGLVEIDAAVMARSALEVGQAALEAFARPVAGVGVTTQRASAVSWDRRNGQPLGPVLGWQDLRTAGTCLEKQAEGLNFSPSESATKFSWLLDQMNPELRSHAVVGTVDTWIAWNLSAGALHVTDPSNAGVTGLYDLSTDGWDTELLSALGIDQGQMPSIVDSSGHMGVASVLPGGPPLCALIGDQQASLVGQSCTRRGLAKATFGTGGMLDVCLGDDRPARAERQKAGCFPIAAWSRHGEITWGLEAIMLAAGNAISWMVDDLGIISDPAESESVAGECEDTNGVVAVPALLGYGTPQWDFGARGALFGLSQGIRRSHIVRAVLEGVAHSGADLLEAAERDTGLAIKQLRVDGGMAANSVFVQALADACDRPIEVSRQLEATTLGAGFLAGLATGLWSDIEEISRAWSPKQIVEPSGRPSHRDRWRTATERAAEWYPELTAIRF
jgi:glycerol kinase